MSIKACKRSRVQISSSPLTENAFGFMSRAFFDGVGRLMALRLTRSDHAVVPNFMVFGPTIDELVHPLEEACSLCFHSSTERNAVFCWQRQRVKA